MDSDRFWYETIARQKLQITLVSTRFEGSLITLIEKENYVIGNPISVLSVGRWHWKKGYNYSIDAVANLHFKNLPIKYEIIAHGDIPEEILFQVKESGLEEIISFHENVNQDFIFKAMQNADCLLLPSVEEGIANVVLEAMAIGLPVISTKCGGMAEIIKNRKNMYYQCCQCSKCERHMYV